MIKKVKLFLKNVLTNKGSMVYNIDTIRKGQHPMKGEKYEI